jgi:antitoxin YefM
MPIQTTYSSARENLASLLDQVTEDREIVIISRRGYDDVALVAVSELASLLETAHLLRSPKNAQRLLKALRRAQARSLKPQPLEKLRRNLGLDEKE